MPSEESDRLAKRKESVSAAGLVTDGWLVIRIININKSTLNKEVEFI